MLNRAAQLSIIAALLATSACTKKKPLPPPPPPATAPSTAGATSGTGGSVAANTASANTAGSVADFKAVSGGDTVLFGYDSYEIDDPSRVILGKQAEWLARYPQVKVTIQGHTDERGTREYNLALGDRRANAAKNFLAAQGVATARIATISYGKERPVAEGSDESAWAQNRRAVTVITSGAR